MQFLMTRLCAHIFSICLRRFRIQIAFVQSKPSDWYNANSEINRRLMSPHLRGCAIHSNKHINAIHR